MLTDSRLRIAVCDDVSADCTQIMNMTEQILQEANILHSISGYESADALLKDIEGGERFHILLLDVMMDEMDGMELAARLRSQGNRCSIIFISINREMALYGYELAAVRYLAKPVEKEKLEEALLHCNMLWQEKKEILIPTAQGQYRTSFSDIQFVEAFDRGTRFYFEGKMVESRMKLGDVEAWLPKSAFVICHRAFIVNLSHVSAIRNYEFTLQNGSSVPISKYRYGEVYKRFIEYIAN